MDEEVEIILGGYFSQLSAAAAKQGHERAKQADIITNAPRMVPMLLQGATV
ncbi:MAG: hypothetical protein JO278_06060 [Dyella sp.]|nr:hypothetical protein [Dyella sp.]MBV8272016.1 hypothetical protein [Cupriavidus sp.]